jgi:hypothetical protein
MHHPVTGAKQSLSTLRQGPDGTQWTDSAANEFGRLFQGVGTIHQATDKIKGTDTCFFITKSQVPPDRQVTYANFICSIRPQKKETHRVCCTVGGDKLDYPGDASSPAVSMLDTKVHLNSVLQHQQRNALCMEISNYYLSSPISHFQYMCINRKDILCPEIIANTTSISTKKAMHTLESVKKYAV